MKIAMLNTFDSGGGAARSAYRLHKGILAEGEESRFIAQYNKSGDPDIVCEPRRRDKVLALLRPLMDMLPLKLYRRRKQREPFSTAYLPPRRYVRKAIERADIAHLHWVVHGFFSVEYLAKINRPVLWTLHDSWAFTGGCHLPGECIGYEQKCGACPILSSERGMDLTRLNWHRKRHAWRDLNMVVVCPSQWLADRARASSLFRDASVRVIPNGIDASVFKPLDKTVCRDILGLPRDHHLILFGAMGAVVDPNKGFDLFAEALSKLPKDIGGKPCMLAVFGARNAPHQQDVGIKARFFGTLSDDTSLALLYAAADVMVVPSRQENLPNTIMEAMACGTPGVAFRTGGIPDMIDHKVNGYLATPYDTTDLANGIEWVLLQGGELGARGRAKVEQNFTIEVVSRRYIELYHELLGATDGGI